MVKNIACLSIFSSSPSWDSQAMERTNPDQRASKAHSLRSGQIHDLGHISLALNLTSKYKETKRSNAT